MRAPALQLLRYRIDVAEPPLEGLGRENRRRTSLVIHRVHHIACFMDRVGGGLPHRHAIVQAELAGLFQLFLDQLQRMQQPRTRRLQPRVRVANDMLYRLVVAQR